MLPHTMALREDLDFSDVTLVCEEDKQIKAHRVILSAYSPFFSTVLKWTKHSHPMIYMRGLKSKDLVAIVNYIYHGEANIYQEDLDDFLALAEELQLKGLAGSTNRDIGNLEVNIKFQPIHFDKAQGEKNPQTRKFKIPNQWRCERKYCQICHT